MFRASSRASGALCIALIVAAGLWACTPDEGTARRERERGERPNVLLIVTDDQRIETLSVMPEVRRWFRRNGTEFTPGFVTTPLCCPSRASIFTGRYMHNHGVLTNLHSREFEHRYSMQAYLQDAGYTTAIIGKYLNALPVTYDPPHFDHYVVPKDWPYEGGDWNVDGQTRSITTYATSFMRKKAVDFLTDTGPEPWFLTIAPIAPHGPTIPEPRYADADVPPWEGNPSVGDDRSDKPPLIRQLPAADLERAKRRRADQLRTLMSVDDLIGRVHDVLARTDQLDDTLAFFISDNGLLWGEFGYGNKTVPYTSSVQVPFLMTWPGHVPTGPDDRMALNVDIAATIVDATGAQPAPGVPLDGRSLLDQWNRDRILLEYHRYQVFDTPSWRSIRTRTAQYVQYVEGDGNVTFEEYYDLVEDPWQLNNLLAPGSSVHPGGVDRLRRAVERYKDCRGEACP